MMIASAQAFDDAKYPDWSGQWIRRGGVTNRATWDPDKPRGIEQEPPLTAEYQAIFEANLADQRAGGQGTNPSYRCVPAGMPRLMIGRAADRDRRHARHHLHACSRSSTSLRRIYTDGRAMAADDRATLQRLFDRPLGGHRRRRPLRHAGRGDPRHARGRVPSTTAAFRCMRTTDGRQGAHLFRQGEPGRPAGRDHHHRQRADASLDA